MTPKPVIKLKPAEWQAFSAADVLTWPLIGSFLRWRYSRRVMQTILLLITGVIIFDGLLGPQLAPKNLATVTAWIHYRGLVVLALLIVGNLFCMACPFMLPRELGRWLGKALGMQRGVPRVLRNKWLAAALLVAFFIIYELYDLWASPWLTAWVIMAYFLTALVVDTFFQGAAFCKYVCPLGQFNFFGSLISPTEIKVRQAAVCGACQTKDCIAGNQQTGQRGCELWLFQEQKVGNMDCTFCLDCVYACPHDNIGLIARLPTRELWTDPRRSGLGRFWQRWDLTALTMVLIAAAYLNAFGMVTPVYALQQRLLIWLHTTSEAPGLLIIFAMGLIILPLGLLWLTGLASRLLVDQPKEPVGVIVRRFTYALVPLGFGVWLAHYLFHFMTGALTLLPVAQSFLNDSGLNVGPERWQLGPLVPSAWLFPIQALSIFLGLFGSMIAGVQLAERFYQNSDTALRAFLPWGILLVLMMVLALWLMAQPMEMRGTMFVGA